MKPTITLLLTLLAWSVQAQDPPNFLLITADDLNWNSVGVFGSSVDSITPNIDNLASEGMRFEYGHVTNAVCHASRSALVTGRFSHNNGVSGCCWYPILLLDVFFEYR